MGLGSWRKNFFVRDQVGNTRLVLEWNSIRSHFEYEPFGEKIETASVGAEDRTSFIGKERDGENCLSDFGVRKYQEDVGRFMQAEPLWEKFYRWSPWAYSGNNPLIFKDNNGKFKIKAEDAAKFPAFNNIVNNVMIEVMNNPEVMDAMSKASGLNANRIKNEILTPGKGPVLDLVGSMGLWHGMTSNSKTSVINMGAIQDYENSTKPEFDESFHPSKELQKFFVTNLLLHEGAIASWFKNTNRKPIKDCIDAGELFEINLYGKTIHSTNDVQQNLEIFRQVFKFKP